MHKLLERQLRRHLNVDSAEGVPNACKALIAAVDEAYCAADADRALLERSLELVSEELSQRNAELARSNGELFQFAYAASHDLQEPLRSIAGYGQLLQRRYQERLDPDAQEFLEGIVGAARRLQSLIAALLSYTRVGASPSFALVDCNVALEQAVANLRASVEETGAELILRKLPSLTADLAQLVQIFQNLIGNALKFRGADRPRVEVWAHHHGKEWVFSVRDNGIGVPADHVARIFRIFQRLHDRTKYPGTGVGLAISDRIAAKHGGRIWVESEPGRGSVFHFTISDSLKESQPA